MYEKHAAKEYQAYTHHNYAGVVALSVITFLQLIPQATLQQFTYAGETAPLDCVIATVVPLVALAKDVVKYSVNTLLFGQQELPFLGT